MYLGERRSLHLVFSALMIVDRDSAAVYKNIVYFLLIKIFDQITQKHVHIYIDL